MIVDCYTHTWESDARLGRDAYSSVFTPLLPPEFKGTSSLPSASEDEHLAASEHADKTFVIGFTSRYLDASIANDHIAAYVAHHPGRLLGFAGIDPSDSRSAIDEVRRCRSELAMVGAAVAPSAQDFHPSNSKAMLVYQQMAELGMPVIFHTGPYVGASCKLEYARPVLLDEVARELPQLKMVIAHLGSPWIDETMLILAKHANVYADISWVLHRPWHAYLALLSAYQFGVMHKLLFGSGFPFASAARCIEMLYEVNQFSPGTNLPPIPRRELRGIVERDATSLLGIGQTVRTSQRESQAMLDHEADE